MKIYPSIRSLNMVDWPHIVSIEESVADKWGENEFRKCFYSKYSRQIRIIVAEYQERIVGYSVFKFHDNRIHVLRLATLGSFMRRGVASALFKHVSDKLSNIRPELTTEIDEANLPMQLFLKSVNAKAVGINRNNGNYCFKFKHDFKKLKAKG